MSFVDSSFLFVEDQIMKKPDGGSIIIINDTYSLYEDETVTISVGTYSKTAVIEDGTATIKGFTETGTVTVSVSDFTKTFNIDKYSKYETNVGNNPHGGFDYSAWLGSISESTSGYSSLADVLADEEMVRELFTRHASVDYLVSVSASSDIAIIINYDYCAKWINLRDYALDTLYADSNISALMDESDKYFYGEWVITDNTTNPVTWGAKGNVPVMTSNSAPYGTASAYQVFDGSPSTTASGTDFSYQSTNPICVRDFICKNTTKANITSGTLQGSNDGSTWTSIPTPSENMSYYLYHRVHFASSHTVATIQFYGRELKVSVPKMTSDTAPYGEAFASSELLSTNDLAYAWHVFDRVTNQNDGTYVWAAGGSGHTNNEYVGYKFNIPIKVNFVAYYQYSTVGDGRSPKNYKIQGSNDGNNWDTIYEGLNTDSSTFGEMKVVLLNNTNVYKQYRFYIVDSYGDQSTGWTGLPELQFYGLDYSEYDWDEDNPRHYIYDHGVKLEEIILKAGDNGYCFEEEGTVYYGTSGSTSTNIVGIHTASPLDLTDYALLRGVAGNKGNSYIMECGTSNFHSTTADITLSVPISNYYNTLNLDISYVNQSLYVGSWYAEKWYDAAGLNTSIKELWLE